MERRLLLQFTVAAVGLLIISAIFGITIDSIAEGEKRISAVSDRPHITILSADVNQQKASYVGDFVKYEFSVYAKIALNKQKEDLTIVPVLTYKGQDTILKIADASGNIRDSFLLPAGSLGDSYGF